MYDDTTLHYGWLIYLCHDLGNNSQHVPGRSDQFPCCAGGMFSDIHVYNITIRVFVSVPGSSVPQNDVPDSFYKLSGEEIRNEAKMRRERLEQSRLLIPKSYKEKHALAARQKYKQAVIRVQFPDRMILQGIFLPGEATGSLYE
ncbi:hypothetical protein ACJX0J_031325, partial [Zea mays]